MSNIYIRNLGEAEEPTQTDEFRKKLIEKILMVLNSGSDEECAICLEDLKTPVITHCAHLFCRPCIEAVIATDKPVRTMFIFLPELSHSSLYINSGCA